MPNKTIYVSDSDLPLYDRAAELAGSLSAAITTSLKSFVDSTQLQDDGFEQISVTITKDGVRSTKRFMGKRICRVISRDGNRLRRYSAYHTPKGKLAVVLRNDPDLVGLVTKVAGNVTDPNAWNEDFFGGHRELMVFDSLEEALPDLPQEVVDAIRVSQETPRVEDLDI